MTDAELLENKTRILLSKPKPKFQSLGMGVNNGVFYYGTKIYEGDKGYDAIVTSDKKIYVAWPNDNQIKIKFGLNYRCPFYDALLVRSWSNKSIDEWLYGSPKIPTFKETFDELVAINKKYMWYIDESTHEFIALDIMATYFTEIFDCRGRTLIVADKGSGKTRQSTLYSLLSFNPIMSPDWTKSSLFRSVEGDKPTIIIDNFDDMPEELRKDIMSIYRQYKRGVKSIRTEGQGKYEPKGYDLFCPIVLNNLLGLNEIDEDRSKKVFLLKSKDRGIVNVRLNESDSFWGEVQDRLFVMGLARWEEVRNAYRSLKEDEFVGRDLEVIHAPLSIAKLVSADVYDRLVKGYSESLSQKKVRDLEEDWIYLVMKHLWEVLKDEDGRWVKVSEPSKYIMETLYFDLDPQGKPEEYTRRKRSISIKIGKVLSNNPLFKGRQVEGTAEYFFTLENVNKFCEIKDYPIDEEG